MTGGKYMSVKNLLDLRETSRAFVLETGLARPGALRQPLLGRQSVVEKASTGPRLSGSCQALQAGQVAPLQRGHP